MPRLAAALGWRCSGAGLGLRTWRSGARASPGDAIVAVALADLPLQARQTLALIERGGPFPFPHKDGSSFGNFEKRLPIQARGYYREHNRPHPRQRRPRRTPNRRRRQRVLLHGRSLPHIPPDTPTMTAHQKKVRERRNFPAGTPGSAGAAASRRRAQTGVFQVNLGDAKNIPSFIKALNRDLDFPDWFGDNLDALHDCLTDFSPAPGPRLCHHARKQPLRANPTSFAMSQRSPRQRCRLVANDRHSVSRLLRAGRSRRTARRFTRPRMSDYKRPVSVLVVIHTPQLQILLLERALHAGYWQSVTGSQEDDESLIATGGTRSRRGNRNYRQPQRVLRLAAEQY